MEDGKVIIGTALDTKDLEKQLKDIQRQLTRYEKDAEKLATVKAKVEVDLQEYEKEKQAIQQSTDKSLELSQTREQVNWVLDSEKMQIDQLNEKYSKQFEQLNNVNKKIEENAREQEVLKLKVQETTQELEKQKQSANMQGILNNINSNITKITRSVGKWALAVFSIRSAYMLVRQAVSTLASEDDQIKYDIEYLRWILAQTLKPIVEWLISALYYVLTIINNIAQRIFDINLLTGKSADDFKKAKKSTGGMAKDLADAKKQLAGFDEMNVLTDNKSSAGGGGGGIDDWIPPDLGKKKKQLEEIGNEFVKRYKEAKEALNMPLENWFKSFGEWGLLVRGVVMEFVGLTDMILGLSGVVEGTFDIIKGIFTGDTKKIDEGLKKVIEGFKLYFTGILEFFLGQLEAFVGGVLGVVLWLWNKITGNSEENTKNMATKLNNVAPWIDKNIIKPVAKFFTDLWNGLVEGVKDAVKKIKDFFNGIPGFFRGIVDTIMGFFRTIGTNVGNAIGGAFKGIINSVLDWITNKINGFLRSINNAIDYINAIPLVNIPKLKMVSFPRLAKGGIINMPGRGVPVGSAIAGERGQEGVIPLTDSQQMELLGQSIGKYITINANITNTMNGRVISKELQKIQAENDFAFNK